MEYVQTSGIAAATVLLVGRNSCVEDGFATAAADAVIRVESWQEAIRVIAQGSIQLVVCAESLFEWNSASWAFGRSGPCLVLFSSEPSLQSVVDAIRAGAVDFLHVPMDSSLCMDRLCLAMDRGVLEQRNRARLADIVVATDALHAMLDIVGREPTATIHLGNIVADTRRHVLFIAGRSVHVTAIEWRLALTFLQRPDEAISYRHLALSVYEQDIGSDARALLRPHVVRLRVKIQTHDSLVELRSIRAWGYMVTARTSEEH